MQIFKTIWWYGILSIITGTAIFCIFFLRVSAEEIAGDEVYLTYTHTHTEDCYGMVTRSCEGTHTFRYNQQQHNTFNCVVCGTRTDHLEVYDHGFCAHLGTSWIYNGKTTCTVCGNLYLQGWNGYPANQHNTVVRELICGIAEGSSSIGIQIVADNCVTNDGVTLHVKQNMSNANLTNTAITYDWGTDTLFVTENGTYSVTATDSSGNAVTASITISCIDKAAPVIETVNHDSSSVTQSSVTVMVLASDGESGLSENAYSIDGGATWSGQNVFSVSEGNAVNLMIRDNAGNVTQKTIQRSDFPYPPAPTPVPTAPPVSTPTPVPTPAPTVTPASTPDQTFVPTPVPTLLPEPANTPVPETLSTSKPTATPKAVSDSNPMADSDVDRQEADRVNENINTEQEGAPEEEAALGSVSTVTSGNAGGSGETSVSAGNAEAGMATTQSVKPTSKPEFMHAAVPFQEAEEEGTTIEKKGLSGTGILSQKMLLFMGEVILGMTVLVTLILAGRFLWIYSAILYCYDGGDEYRKLGVFFLHKKEEGMELYLPEYLTETTDVLRYRLHLKKGLVKRCAREDLVVCSEDGELRRPLEECVDFVL